MRGMDYIFAVHQPMTNLYTIVIIVHLILHHMPCEIYFISSTLSISLDFFPRIAGMKQKIQLFESGFILLLWFALFKFYTCFYSYHWESICFDETDMEQKQQYTNYLFQCVCVFFFHRPRTGFDKSSLERLEQLFRKTVGNEKEIRREDFKKIVTSKNVRF